jgi:hypothetical protein
MKDEIGNSISFNNFIKEKSIVVIELSCLAFNIKKEVCDDFDFLFFSFKYEKNDS